MAESTFKTEMEELKLKRERLELQDLEDKLAEREMKKENARAIFHERGRALSDTVRMEGQAQQICTHRKGGPGHLFKSGGGNDTNYSVIKHTLPNRDILVMCTRCQRKWLPPIEPKRAHFKVVADYDLAMVKFKEDQAEYKTALAFLTDNSPSSGATFMFSDNGAACREAVKNS